MNHVYVTFAATAVMLTAFIGGCSSVHEAGEYQDSDSLTASRGEHDRDGGKHGGEGFGDHGSGKERGEHGRESGSEHKGPSQRT